MPITWQVGNLQRSNCNSSDALCHQQRGECPVPALFPAWPGPAANAIQHLPCKWQLSCRHRLVGSRELVNQTTVPQCHGQRQPVQSVLSRSSRKSAAGAAVSLAHFHLPDSSRCGWARLGAINRRSTGALIAINLH